MSYTETSRVLLACGLTRPQVERLTRKWRPDYSEMPMSGAVRTWAWDFVEKWRSIKLSQLCRMANASTRDMREIIEENPRLAIWQDVEERGSPYYACIKELA